MIFKQDLTGIPVTKTSRARIKRCMNKQIALQKRMMTYDEYLNMLLDVWESVV